MSYKIWKVNDLISWGKDYLEKKKVDAPRLSIEQLLCKVLNYSRIDLYLKFDKPLLDNELKELKSYIERLVLNEPLQYILGETEFFGLTLKVDKSVLIPRPETELLCEIITNDLKVNHPESILDIGTGSGCIALSLASSFQKTEVFAIDISYAALRIAEDNARLNKIANVKFFELDILKKVPKKKFPLIVSNPPYISKNDIKKLDKKVKDFEPFEALSDNEDGNSFYLRFANKFSEMLEKSGSFYLELNEDSAKETEELFLATKNYNVELLFDQYSKPRFLKGNLKN